jgi:hypothetical protein
MPPFAPAPDGNGDHEKCHYGLRPEPPGMSVPCYLLGQWNRNRGGTFTDGVGGVHRRNETVPPARLRLNVKGMIGGVVQCGP